MFEADKIEEANFFYAELVRTAADHQANPKKFKWLLSAFLSAARSVLQYAHKEAVPNPKTGSPGKLRGQQWYEGATAKSPVLKFFKDKRDINIHREPASVLKSFDVQIGESLNIQDSVDLGDSFGESVPPLPATPTSHTTVRVAEGYKFADWPGSEGVLELCKDYLHQLRVFVEDGKQKGLLTP